MLPHLVLRLNSKALMLAHTRPILAYDIQQGLGVHPFDPLCAPGARLKRICKILCLPRNLVAAELHDAHGVGRLTVICQDVFGDPKITVANDSPHSETLFAWLLGACDLYVTSTADPLA